MAKSKHNWWHYILTVFIYEIIHLMWFVAGTALTFGGLAIFFLLESPFYKMAIGGPITLIGGSIALFNFFDVISLAFNSQRVKGLCFFCK